jgi:hypothetical protein
MSLLESATLRWCARAFGDDIAERIFVPLIADWQHEVHAHASARARALVHARWTTALAGTGLVVGVSLLLCWRVPREEARPVLRTVALAALAGTSVLFAALLMMVLERRPSYLTPVFALTLLANVATVAAPLSLGPGAARLAAMSGDRRARRWFLAGLTVGVLTLQTLAVGWIEPAARALNAPRHPQYVDGEPLGPSIGARSTPRLLLEARQGTGRWLGSPPTRRVLVGRLALTLYPIAIALFAWRLGAGARISRAVAVGVVWLLPAGLLLTPSWLVFSYRVGGDYGTPAALLQFLPTALLLALAWWLGPADAEAHVSTLEHPAEAR